MSALIFVALAVAWAVYLVPKALRHHEEVAGSRSVEKFSDTMRVLARREPVDRRSARLVVTPGRPAATAADPLSPAFPEAAPPPIVGAAEPAAPTTVAPAPAADPRPLTPARRAAARRAAQRRRRVLGTVLALNAVVVALAAFAVCSWWYVAVPAGLLAGWLVACRLMVRSERGLSRRLARPSAAVVDPLAPDGPGEVTEEVPVVAGETGAAGSAAGLPATDPGLWDPVPVTLPTYVSKPAAARTVRTIDLDSTGVWTSGRSEADSRLAREAEEAERAERAADGDDQRAFGS